MTAVRYPDEPTAADIRAVNQQLRDPIEDVGRLARIEGEWWQHSLTLRTDREPSAISLLKVSRERAGDLRVAGRAWQEDGTLSSRYWSVASSEGHEPSSVFYFWNGERPRHPNAPMLEGTGEIRLEDADRAVGYWTTRSEADSSLHERTSGIYVRADPADMRTLEGADADARAALLAQRLTEWKAISST